MNNTPSNQGSINLNMLTRQVPIQFIHTAIIIVKYKRILLIKQEY